jgi:hypothetical protein
LKNRACLLRNHSHWTAGSNDLTELFKEFEDFRIALGEQRLHGEFATRIPKVLSDENVHRIFGQRQSGLRFVGIGSGVAGDVKAFLRPNSA